MTQRFFLPKTILKRAYVKVEDSILDNEDRYRAQVDSLISQMESIEVKKIGVKKSLSDLLETVKFDEQKRDALLRKSKQLLDQNGSTVDVHRMLSDAEIYTKNIESSNESVKSLRETLLKIDQAKEILKDKIMNLNRELTNLRSQEARIAAQKAALSTIETTNGLLGLSGNNSNLLENTRKRLETEETKLIARIEVLRMTQTTQPQQEEDALIFDSKSLREKLLGLEQRKSTVIDGN